MIKVSIIVPVYGVEKYIEKCARSVFEQTYSNLEIIFVDDCTPDNSINVLRSTLEEYPTMKDKTQILSYPKNKGLAGARKFGLEHASGDYVLQIDSDDYIDVNMVEAMVAEVEKTDADIVICDMNLIGFHGSYSSAVPSLEPDTCLRQVLMGEVHGSVANKLIRKSLYVDHDIWPIEGLNMREDLSVMYRLLYFAKKLAYINQPLYNYIQQEGSVSSFRMSEKQQKNAQDLIVNMNEFCAKEQIHDNDLLEAFKYFKTLIKADILLHGTISLMDDDLYKGVTLKYFFSHPLLSKYQKIMALVSATGINSFVSLARKVADSMKRFKKQ